MVALSFEAGITLLLVLLLLIGSFVYVQKSKLISSLRSEIDLQNGLLDSKERLIGEQKNKLIESERWARVVRQSPNGIMMMDRDGNVLDVNNGFVEMYEYGYEEFVKARGSNYRKTSFSNEVLERIDRIVGTKKPVKYEALNITKSGKKLWTQTALTPILNEKGDFDGMVTIDTDIHKRIVTSDVLIEKMERINSTIDTTSHHFKILATEAKSLFETINETNELLDQTALLLTFVKEISDSLKILGINASIEAHLAGLNGKGFRVVANEIVAISNKGLVSVAQISDLLFQVSSKQDQLLKDKQGSSESLIEHQRQMKLLKKEIGEVENAIAELKTVS